jgi:hypothetical protein
LAGPVAFASEGGTQRLFPPGSEPYGRPYAEWFAEWVEWFIEIPTPSNPAVDPASPENCELEDGSIVFLGPSGANCRIPKGKAVAFSPAGWECSTAEGLGRTYAKLRRCAIENWAEQFGPAVLDVSIRIDGRILRHPRRWTHLTPVPSDLIDFPEENLFGGTPGPSKSVTKGLFYILRPLSPGTHNITVHSEHELLGDSTNTYKLEVRPRRTG